MSRLVSPVQKINNLIIEALPAGKVICVAKAIKVDGMTFVLGTDGKVYNNTLDKRCYLMHRWRFLDPLLNALNRLGVITRPELREHIQAARRADEYSDLQHLIGQFTRLSKQLDMPLTMAQQRKLNKKLKQKGKR